MNVLLMTATIDSGYFGNASTVLTDTETRKQQYYEALTKYLTSSNFDIIVFAENSKYPFDTDKFNQLAKEQNKIFEYLQIETSIEKTRELGKSYGEAHLIAEAFKNSKYISNEKCFYKVTGRVWIKNINKLINEKEENIFITHNTYYSCLTVFFKVKTDTFSKCLKVAENLCNDYSGWNFIEKVYYDLLENEKIRVFGRYPDLDGKVGGLERNYNKSKIKLFLANILLKLGYYNYRSKIYTNTKLMEKMEIFVAKITS